MSATTSAFPYQDEVHLAVAGLCIGVAIATFSWGSLLPLAAGVCNGYFWRLYR